MFPDRINSIYRMKSKIILLILLIQSKEMGHLYSYQRLKCFNQGADVFKLIPTFEPI